MERTFTMFHHINTLIYIKQFIMKKGPMAVMFAKKHLSNTYSYRKKNKTLRKSGDKEWVNKPTLTPCTSGYTIISYPAKNLLIKNS